MGEVFQWGSRGLWAKTSEEGFYIPMRFIADGIRLQLLLTNAFAGKGRHIFHVKNPAGTPTYSDCVALADALKDWWNSDYKNMVNGVWTARLAVAAGINANPAAIARTVIDTPGVRSGNDLPNSVACAIEFGTRSTGRTHHGGVRALGMVEADVDHDRFTSGYLTAIGGVMNNLVIRVGVLGYALSVASLVDQQCYPIREVFVTSDIIASQKTRRASHGE